MASSLLATDGYKFSMAEAGWPLRTETFYYSHRKGGAQVLPFDVETQIRALLPEATPDDYAFLSAHDYEMGTGFKAAIQRRDQVVVRALPKGSVFFPHEPVFSVTGPSALISWLEPLALQLNYRIQVATAALRDPSWIGDATCERQKQLILETFDAVGVKAPVIRVDPDGYRARVKARAEELVGIVGDPRRLFEVGLRAATCLEQHEIALGALQEAGIARTSNVLGAMRLGMVPVGTMGHEHVQRFGSDEAAFRAMRERRPQRSSYLLDTYDTITRGIPAAYELISENPNSGDSIRYDSGDKEAQYLFAAELARQRQIRPVQILEDSFDAALTRRFEELRRQVGWGPLEQFYGYGGWLVAGTMRSELTRDRVSAVYKLSQTGKLAVMKFGNEAGSGKQSLPGRPVVFRRHSGTGPFGIVGQQGELPPPGYFLLTGSEPGTLQPTSTRALGSEGEVALSEATRALVADAIRRAGK